MLEFKQFLCKKMKKFSAFLVIIRTNFGKIIGLFVDSKFESTRGMKCKVSGEEYTDRKLITNIIIYYFLDDQLVKCPQKHIQKSWMVSNDEFFLSINGIYIMNNRCENDIASVSDNEYSGL